MSTGERRQSRRTSANGLEIDLCTRNWLGRWMPPHRVIGADLSHHGLAVITPLKLKEGQLLRLTIGNRQHRLLDLPARVIRAEARGADFLYGIRFELDDLSQAARRSYDTLLKLLQDSVSH
ncbi:PilZ domain-containing protein [Parathalassolituus penaei]|uniref:PilZ domain-containing protein n=1 Tax=Parathalassolituus penaei TaxID=2997323 RepID=A0A9X3EGB2_9GAMM|nr:PilZ domain-containing protein [Parathalassolituus penaei]MCY0963766.1 PilZ domain-containing protein [Parathalassolituus penaei]